MIIETPELDVLIDRARKYTLQIEAKNLQDHSLSHSFDTAIWSLPEDFIRHAASSTTKRFPYIREEIRGILPLGARWRAARYLLRGIVVWYLINDPRIIAHIADGGFIITDRGLITVPT